jgi:hypothetical protein
MLGRIRRGLTFANVCSFIAVTLALGTSGAYAANTVFSTDIVDGEVKNADLGNNQVTSAKIYPGSVTMSDIHDDAVDGSKILDAAISAGDLGQSSVGSDEIATDAVGATEVIDGAIDSGEIFNESLGSVDLAANSVTASELAPSAVTSGDIANNTITTADILGADTSGNVSLSGVPNGRCSQVSLGVSGAQPGQVALLSFNAPLQAGILFYAQRVQAAGNVMANICNFSGGAMTPIVDQNIRVITFG